VLSQAIYLIFHQAFADSRLYFNDRFKENICNTIGEWVLGIKPIPESYKKWTIQIETDPTHVETKVTSNADCW
jgi:hypothetical protein